MGQRAGVKGVRMEQKGSPLGPPDSEAATARAVQEMFARVAPRYDFLNHFLSAGFDLRWRRAAAEAVRPALERPGSVAADLCCGTGDLTFALARFSAGHVVGADFCHPMLVEANKKIAAQHRRTPLFEADALALPLADNSLDLITVAFGFRNLANYDRGLAEIYRVLGPNGEIGILDFGEPKGLIGALYRVYFRHVLPAIGTLISGVSGPYSYLPKSVQRFPTPEEMLKRMQTAGFREVSWTPYTFGIAGLYRGKK